MHCNQPTSREVGIWTQLGHLWQFNEDGTYSVANSVDDLTSAPIEFGEFRLEGTRLTYIPDEESEACAGTTGIYEVEMVEDGSRFKRTKVEDDCVTGPVIPSVFFERYSP